MAARSTPGSPRPLLLVAPLLLALGCTPVASTAPSPTSPPPTTAITAPPSPTPPPAFPMTITDDEGTEVTIEAEPLKIVSLTPSSTEILFALGAGDRVVAKVEDIVSGGQGFPPEAASIPVVATFAGVDVEQIVALEADLVISGGAGLSQGPAVEQLRNADIPVLVAYPTTIDGALAGIRFIGQAIGAAEEGEDLATTMRQQLDALAVIASTAVDQPRLFYEIDVTGGIFTPPTESIYGEMFELAGAEPISGDAFYSITLETLVDADPEVILLGDAAYGVTAEAVAARPGWGGMTAVKEGRIVPIDDTVVTRPGPRLVEGLFALIEAIHPELDVEMPTAAVVRALAAAA